MGLIDVLNTGHSPNSFITYSESIPKVMHVMGAEGRDPAGGQLVLTEILDALNSGDSRRVNTWLGKHFSFADACFVSGNTAKIQFDSPFLRGMKGTMGNMRSVEPNLFVAIGADEVQSAVEEGGMHCFEVMPSADVGHLIREGKKLIMKYESVTDVVLLPYDRMSVFLSPAQFNVLKADYQIDISQLAIRARMPIEDFINDNKVIAPIIQGYPTELMVPLIEGLFRHVEEQHDPTIGVNFVPPYRNADSAVMRVLAITSFYGLSNGGSFEGPTFNCAKPLGHIPPSYRGRLIHYETILPRTIGVKR